MQNAYEVTPSNSRYTRQTEKMKTNEANISQELKKHCTCTLLQAKTHATTG